ncbi:heme-dependent oxidative N-demethylase subunit alpha family protein [Rhodococcus gannanensis]|uniref:Heme-dependent oxidative N-demethylase subunit alpha family protein n=1 Tax=Rhodococcus gannanensis TaxID=1960308 RepID=A0ABW4PBC6_9NOCA
MTLPVHISDLARLPWPFPDPEDAFTPVSGEDGAVGDLGSDYVEVMASRAAAFAADPGLLRLSSDTAPACWDAMLYLMGRLAADYPDSMELHRDGTEYRWVNRLLGIDQDFLQGNSGTLPEHPLTFIGRQVPEDILLLTERDGALRLDAVPAAAGKPELAATEWFLRPLTVDQVYRQMNWTFAQSDSGADAMVDAEWGRIRMRIEVEHLTRLPVTGALMVTTRSYTASLADIATVAEWAEQLADAVECLPAEVAASRGVDVVGAPVVAWLRAWAAATEETVAQGDSAA